MLFRLCVIVSIWFRNIYLRIYIWQLHDSKHTIFSFSIPVRRSKLANGSTVRIDRVTVLDRQTCMSKENVLCSVSDIIIKSYILEASCVAESIAVIGVEIQFS